MLRIVLRLTCEPFFRETSVGTEEERRRSAEPNDLNQSTTVL